MIDSYVLIIITIFYVVYIFYYILQYVFLNILFAIKTSTVHKHALYVKFISRVNLHYFY